MKCVVTGLDEDMCIHSHIIPQRLLSVSRCSPKLTHCQKYDIETGGVLFESQFDPDVSMLLSPNLDHTFGRFFASVYRKVKSYSFVSLMVQGDIFVWQIFRNKLKVAKNNYNSDTWESAQSKAIVRVPNSPRFIIALQWHFRQCIVRNWCTPEIQRLGFDAAETETWVAELYDYGDFDKRPQTDLGDFSDYFSI